MLLKLASGKSIQKKLMAAMLESVWKLAEPADFFKVGKNMLLINFKNQEDQSKVL